MSDVRGAGVTALGPLVLLVAGCGDGNSPSPPASGEDARWRIAERSLDPTGLVWEADRTVHLPDGTRIRLGGDPRTYVVAGDGVFSVVAGEHAVQFTDAEGTVSTGLVLVPGTLTASPDGRFVGGMDARIGAQDAYGTPVATVRVFDLVTGGGADHDGGHGRAGRRRPGRPLRGRRPPAAADARHGVRR